MKNKRQPTANRFLINQPNAIGMVTIKITLIIYSVLIIFSHYNGLDTSHAVQNKAGEIPVTR